MPFEFTLLDALQALRCPVLDALAVFFDLCRCPRRDLDRIYSGASGIPAHPQSRAGHGAGAGLLHAGGPLCLKAAVRTPAPLRPPARNAHAGSPAPWLVVSFRAHVFRLCRCLCALGCRTAGSASRLLCWPGSSASRGCTCMCISPPTFWAAWHWALHWGPAAPCLQIRSATNGRNPVK